MVSQQCKIFLSKIKLLSSFFTVEGLDPDLQSILTQIGSNIFMIATSKLALNRLENHYQNNMLHLQTKETLAILEKSFDKIAILQENMYQNLSQIQMQINEIL